MIKLHRCPFTFVHNNMDSCWKVREIAETINAGKLFDQQRAAV